MKKINLEKQKTKQIIEIVNTPSLLDKPVNKYAICLLTFRPTKDLISLYSNFENITDYEVYIIVDDNEWDIKDLEKYFSKFKFIKIKEEECKKLGFINFNFMVKNGEPSAWDKGLLYFSVINSNKYNYVWFIEDDVFIPKIDNIIKIDKKYPNADLVTKKTSFNKEAKEQWNKCFRNIKKDKMMLNNLCKTMVCICRMSKKLLEIIKEYIEEYKTGFFLEFFFCTIAHYNRLYTKEIDEMNTITYRTNFNIEDIIKNPDNFYHPVKEIKQQQEFWKVFNTYSYYNLIFDLKKVYEKIKFLKMKNIGLFYVQQAIYRNKDNEEMIIQKINNKNNLIFKNKIKLTDNQNQNKESEKMLIHSSEIKSYEDGIILAKNLKYKFICFQTIIEEKYISKDGDLEVEILIYPGLIPILKTSSFNKLKMIRLINDFGLYGTWKKNLDLIINSINLFFDSNFVLYQNYEFIKLNKILKYIKKNKDVFKKLIKEEKEIYEKTMKVLNGDVNKLYNYSIFRTSDNI